MIIGWYLFDLLLWYFICSFQNNFMDGDAFSIFLSIIVAMSPLKSLSTATLFVLIAQSIWEIFCSKAAHFNLWWRTVALSFDLLQAVNEALFFRHSLSLFFFPDAVWKAFFSVGWQSVHISLRGLGFKIWHCLDLKSWQRATKVNSLWSNMSCC